MSASESQELVAYQAPPPARLNVGEARELGQIFYATGWFKDASDEAKAIAKVLVGQELGVLPFAAMQGIDIIDGKPFVGADLLATLVKRSGHYDYRVVESTNERCVLKWFAAGKLIGESDYSIEDAKKAGLFGKQNWQRNPSDMLFARALSRGQRRHAPDVTSGASVYGDGDVIDLESIAADDLLSNGDGHYGAAEEATPAESLTAAARAQVLELSDAERVELRGLLEAEGLEVTTASIGQWLGEDARDLRGFLERRRAAPPVEEQPAGQVGAVTADVAATAEPAPAAGSDVPESAASGGGDAELITKRVASLLRCDEGQAEKWLAEDPVPIHCDGLPPHLNAVVLARQARRTQTIKVTGAGPAAGPPIKVMPGEWRIERVGVAGRDPQPLADLLAGFVGNVYAEVMAAGEGDLLERCGFTGVGEGPKGELVYARSANGTPPIPPATPPSTPSAASPASSEESGLPFDPPSVGALTASIRALPPPELARLKAACDAAGVATKARVLLERYGAKCNNLADLTVLLEREGSADDIPDEDF